jgi:signal transduction histidine kinase
MFQTARLKLTAWYLLIIMTVSILFSLAAYNRFHRELGRLEVVPAPPLFGRRVLMMNDQLIFLEVRQRLLRSLVMINLTILVLSGGLGYWLAGKTLKPIRKMVEEQNRFVSDASHELKTPLTSLKTAFEVYLRAKKKSAPESLVKESLSEVNKLQKLTEGLLVLSRDQRPQLGPVKLQSVINSARQRVKPLAQAKKIKINHVKTSLKVRANEDLLTDLLVILLDNGIKYSPFGSEVKIVAKRDGGQGLITVSDHGVGIAPKDLPRVFDRFYRADKSRTKNNSGGYGLGLAIAKKITEQFGGKIKVASRLNHGTSFQLSFSLVN